MNRHLRHTCRIHLRSAAALLAMIVVGALSVQTSALAAGSPSRSVPKSDPAHEKRQNANTFFKKGEAYQEQGNYEKASKEYEKAVKADPHYAEAYSNLGYTYRKQGRFDQAVSTYKQALALKPDLAEAHEYIGEAYAEMGRFDLAEEHLGILRDLGAEEAAELAEFIEKQRAGAQ